MEKNKTYATFAVFSLFSALAGGFIGSYWTTAHLNASILETNGNKTVTTSASKTYVEESQVIDTVKKVSPSVVSIIISKDLPLYRQGVRQFGNGLNDPFFNFSIPFQEYERDENGNVKSEKKQIGGGSGFIVSKDGLVVTNRHVVEDEEASYTVITSDGKEYNAEVLARDTLNDFAVIKMVDTDENKVQELPFVSLGDSEALQIGQKVVAIGNALAEFQNTVTTGVVSGKGREVTAGSVEGSEDLVNLIQTDAAINPGNSGGPLVDLAGNVIGINTAVSAEAQGIGFAIPIDDVKSLIETVEKNGKIVRPFLGVRFMLLDEAKAKELQLDVEGGALLVGDEANGEFAVIPGSPADEAGLKLKDVILQVDGQKVDADHPLNVTVAKKNPGDTIRLKIWRSGKTLEIPVTLKEAESK